MAARAQAPSSGPVRLAAVVVEGDTIPYIFLPEVEKRGPAPRGIARKREHWNRLRYNVRKVYPYAVIAAEVLRDVDANLARIGSDKRKRKAYLASVEAELNRRFKGELTDLTITQGQVLVKLINRQTGKPVFHIIREMKSGFSAVMYQSVALLFKNNLRREYDPEATDRDIEMMVRELETELWAKYQQQKAAPQTRR